MPPTKKPVGVARPRKNKRLLSSSSPKGKAIHDFDILNCEMFAGLNLKEKTSTETGLAFDEQMVEHCSLFDPKYPESPERFSHSLQRCYDYGLVERCKRIPSRPATHDEILLHHSPAVIELVKSTKDCKDKDYLYNLSTKYDSVYFHPRTYDLSLLATGCTIDLMKEIVEGKVKNGMAIVRPPGHHAMYNTPCGYCIFNNVGIAAQFALDHLGVKRILIVDWDVHHGQATQYKFYNDSRVLYFSIHRYEHGSFWPELRESNYDYIGEGKGMGYNINVPLNKVGMGNTEYLAIFHQILLPVAHEFSPELVFVSSGYDSSIGCPEGEMKVTPACYAHLTSQLMALANGKTCVVLEGGYCLKSLAEGVALTLRALLGDPCPVIGPTGNPDPSCVESILNVISTLRPFWKSLCFQGSVDLTVNVSKNDQHYCEENDWPQHIPTIEYLGKPMPEVFPVVDCYLAHTSAVFAELDRCIDKLIAETNLSVPENRTCLVYDSKMVLHRNCQEPGHPEKPDRFSAILAGCLEYGLLDRCKFIQSRMASEEELRLFHSSEFISEMKRLSTMKNKDLYQLAEKFRSIYFCRDTYDSARLAAGCVLQVVDEVLTGKSCNGAAVVRPPGHHAEMDEACGFCVFNNVAIAAKYALSKFNLQRILILDWDIHHGNGTQSAFDDDPRVLFLSIHRYNNGGFFPSWVEANYTFVGRGKGEGYNVNVPWNSVGLGDGDYLATFHQVVMPLAYQYDPQLVLVSAGFDAAKGDFLGNCKVTPAGYCHMTQLLSGLANGKLILALEGGYNLASISASFVACVKVLLGDPCPALPVGLRASEKAIQSITNVITTHKKYWSCLQYQVNLPSPKLPSVEGEQLEGAVGGTLREENAVNDLASVLVSLTVSSYEEQEAEDSTGPFTVIPKTDCPHLTTVHPVGDSVYFDVTAPCFVCHSSRENWACLTCYEVFCGRYINAHMLSHYAQFQDHCIAFSFCDFSVWCYKCDSYIENLDVLGPIKKVAHECKFDKPVFSLDS